MATRSGSVAPGVLVYLLREGVTDAAGLEQALDTASGLVGMSGTCGDIGEVLVARAGGDTAAVLAIQVVLYRLCRKIAAQAMALDRLDAVVFTGGVAEHQRGVVCDLVHGMAPLRLAFDPIRGQSHGDRVMSPATAAM